MAFEILNPVLQWALTGLYLVCLGGLFLYGTNCYVLLLRFLSHRRRGREEYRRVLRAFRNSPWFGNPPLVTVQLPVYNERYVVRRLLQAVCSLEYPRDRMEIQVLDDSTDDTVEIIAGLVRHYRELGVDIVHLRRDKRCGFKAGALKEGMKRARGEFLAIFDADFVPGPDFLRRTIPYFIAPRVGMVQARWGHMNPEDSLLTRAQAIGIDGHFAIEQGARAFSGLFLNFNGTAGVWRRRAILEAGGWQADTLTEDMDLSYRAQLAGWELKYLLEVMCPAELPTQVSAFKSQQFRWAKGSIQTARKLMPALLRARCSLFVKYQAILHLTHYLVHPLMVGTIFLSLPVLEWQARKPSLWVLLAVFVFFTLSTFGPSALYAASQRVLYGDWGWRARRIPMLTLVGTGIALNNTRAVLEGLFCNGGEFIRTPKFGPSRSKADGRATYRAKVHVFPFLELGVGLYALAAVAVAVSGGRFWIIPFLLIYACGFLYVSCKGFRESLEAASPQPSGLSSPSLLPYNLGGPGATGGVPARRNAN